MTEDEMYGASSELNRMLHELEHQTREMADRIEELVCRSGRVPVDVKALEVADHIRTIGQLDLSRIEENARKVKELKDRVAGFEREMAIQRHPSAQLQAVA
jgi:hypothetical protein